MLSPVERKRIVGAMWAWVETTPDVPVAGFLENREDRLSTPRELTLAVERETPEGRALLAILEHGVRLEGIEAVTRRFSPPQEFQWAPLS